MRFSDLKIGEEFVTSGGIRAKKTNRHQFEILPGERNAGAIRSTSGTARVNGPSGDKIHAQKQRSSRERLNEIAHAAGFASWSALGRAVLTGKEVHINR